jgi:hypothetical protein
MHESAIQCRSPLSPSPDIGDDGRTREENRTDRLIDAGPDDGYHDDDDRGTAKTGHNATA